MEINEGIPEGALSAEVQLGDVDPMALYRRLIAELNEHSPSQEEANYHLGKTLLPSAWDRVEAKGVQEDTDHYRRALIAIARGDERPLGEIYDEIRRMSGNSVTEIDVEKAAGVARKHNPHQQSRWFF